MDNDQELLNTNSKEVYYCLGELQRLINIIAESLFGSPGDTLTYLVETSKQLCILISQSFYHLFDNIRISISDSDWEVAKILSNHGFIFSLSMNDQFKENILELHNSGRTKLINRAVINYYHNQKYNKLDGIVLTWQDSPLFRRRKQILEDAIWAHMQKKYNLSIPVFHAQAEGILREIILDLDSEAVINTYKQLLSKANEIFDEEPCVFFNNKDQLTIVMNSSFYNNDNRPFGKMLRAKKDTIQPSRHNIMHGISRDYGTSVNSIKLILYLDALISIDKSKYSIHRS